MSLRDHLSDLRWRAAGTRTRVSNAWYRAIGRRARGTRQQYRNWLSKRARARGTAPLPDRVTRATAARTPVLRNRTDPATGRPRRAYTSDARVRRARDLRTAPEGRSR